MKVSFPINGVVKKGGADHIRKIYFPEQKDQWLADVEPYKVIIEFGSVSFVNPTVKEWSVYHSFNNAKTISKWLTGNGFNLDDKIGFVCVEENGGVIHLIRI